MFSIIVLFNCFLNVLKVFHNYDIEKIFYFANLAFEHNSYELLLQYR